MANKVLKIIIKGLLLVFFCLLLIYIFVVASQYAYDVFADQPYQKDVAKEVVKEIEIKQGESVGEIASELEKLKIIEDGRKFSLALRCLDGSNEIKPGTYEVKSTMKPSEILLVISQKEE